MTEVKVFQTYDNVEVDEDVDTIHIPKETFISEVNEVSVGKQYPIKMTSEQMDELWLRFVEHIVSYSSNFISSEIS